MTVTSPGGDDFDPRHQFTHLMDQMWSRGTEPEYPSTVSEAIEARIPMPRSIKDTLRAMASSGDKTLLTEARRLIRAELADSPELTLFRCLAQKQLDEHFPLAESAREFKRQAEAEFDETPPEIVEATGPTDWKSAAGRACMGWRTALGLGAAVEVFNLANAAVATGHNWVALWPAALTAAATFTACSFLAVRNLLRDVDCGVGTRLRLAGLWGIASFSVAATLLFAFSVGSGLEPAEGAGPLATGELALPVQAMVVLTSAVIIPGLATCDLKATAYQVQATPKSSRANGDWSRCKRRMIQAATEASFHGGKCTEAKALLNRVAAIVAKYEIRQLTHLAVGVREAADSERDEKERQTQLAAFSAMQKQLHGLSQVLLSLQRALDAHRGSSNN